MTRTQNFEKIGRTVQAIQDSPKFLGVYHEYADRLKHFVMCLLTYAVPITNAKKDHIYKI